MRKAFGVSVTGILFIVLLTACGGGGGGGGDSATSPILSPTPPPASSSKFTDLDLILKKGDFWEYKWDYDRNYWDSSGNSSANDAGIFRITLGNSKQIAGVLTYEVLVSGRSKRPDWDMTPRWKYLAVSNNQLLASADGNQLVVLMDGLTGRWPGSGFFRTFDSKILCEAQQGAIGNDYISGPAIVVGSSYNKSNCQYFPGVGTVCGGEKDEGLTVYEYYKEKIGPLGFYSSSHAADMSSSYPWSSSIAKNIGLAASSLRGEAVNYYLETEPHDSPATAQAVSLGQEIRGHAADKDNATTRILNEVIEREPNNTRATAQLLNLKGLPASYVEGEIYQTDTSSSFSFYYGGQWRTVNAEDWFSINLGSTTPLTIALTWPGILMADLDLYLFPAASSTPTYYSVGDNPATQSFKETIMTESLTAGNYIIAIDADRTPSVKVPYTLDISQTGKKNEVTIEDWYTFTLTHQATVTISLQYVDSSSDVDLYLFDQPGQALLGSSRKNAGLQEQITMNLSAGTYNVGVDLVNLSATQYTLTIH